MVSACSSSTQPVPTGDEARLLHMEDRDGWTYVAIDLPDGSAGGRYALVPRGASVEVPDSLIRIEVPLKRAVVYSTVHSAAIDELGHADAVVAIADGSYLDETDPIKPRVDAGDVIDLGPSNGIDIERLVTVGADAVLLSPGDDSRAVKRVTSNIIYMADYMEATPLARAQWIKLLGVLFGASERADSIYDAVSHRYNALRTMAASYATRPKVLTDKPIRGVWYVPGGASYMAQFITDAGGSTPWPGDMSMASRPLDTGAVIASAADAPFWLIKDYGDMTQQSLADEIPHAEAFAAWPSGVWVCNSATAPIFRDIAFHPERVLEDFIAIIHPESKLKTQYYTPLAQ